MSDLICFAVPGTDDITYYIEEPDITPEGLVRMSTDIPEQEIPVKNRYIALMNGTWEKVPDNSIFLTNGQARQQRIQREQQQQAAAELLKLKQQVAAFIA